MTQPHTESGKPHAKTRPPPTLNLAGAHVAAAEPHADTRHAPDAPAEPDRQEEPRLGRAIADDTGPARAVEIPHPGLGAGEADHAAPAAFATPRDNRARQTPPGVGFSCHPTGRRPGHTEQ